MKKLFLFMALLGVAFGADAANDLIISQRKADNSGNIQRNVAPTARGFFTFDASKIPASTTDLTYTTPTLSVSDAFAISSAGSIALTAGGTNKNISIKNSTGTTGYTIIDMNGGTLPTPVFSGFQVVGRNATQTGMMVDSIGSNSRFIGRRANGTAGSLSAVQSGDAITQIASGGYGATGYLGARASIGWTATENWTDAAAGQYMFGTVVLTGSLTSYEAWRVDGTGRFVAGNTSGKTVPAWGTVGTNFFVGTNAGAGLTTTDSSSSGTVATAVANSFAVPTFAASSATTFTNAANLYIAGDVANGTNVTLTNNYGLWNVGKSRLDSTVVIGGAGSNSVITTVAGNLLLLQTADTNQPIRLSPNGSGLVQIGTGGGSANTIQFLSGSAIFDAASTPITFLRNAGAANASFVIGASASTGARLLSDADGQLKVLSFNGGTTFATFTAGTLAVGASTSQITGGAGNMTITAGTGASRTMSLQTTTSGSTATTFLSGDASQNTTISKLVSSYNGIATAGNGVSTIQGAGTVTAQTGAASSIATYTLGASDADFIISGQVTVTTSTTHSFTMECAYTDAATNTARTLTFNVSQLNGTFVTLITNILGAGPYESVPLHIKAKASTAITIRTNSGGTYTSVVYSASGVIQKLQ